MAFLKGFPFYAKFKKKRFKATQISSTEGE